MNTIIKKFQFSAILALFALIAINGCDQQDVAVTDELLDETAMTETVFAQLDADVEDAMPYDELSSGRFGFGGFGFGFGNCMSRTVERPDDARYPKVVTISYDSACTSGLHHTVKNGTIIITITGQPSVEGSQRIVTFENFSDFIRILTWFNLAQLPNQLFSLMNQVLLFLIHQWFRPH